MIKIGEKRIRILITTGIYPPEIGGPATYTALLEKEMPKRGTNVLVLPFRTVRNLPKIIRHLAFFLKVLYLGKGADVLYAQDPVSVGFPTMLASKILGKPFLIRVAGDYAWEQAAQRFGVSDSIDNFQTKKYGSKTEILRVIQSLTVANADKVITPSKYFRNLVAGWNRGIDNVITIYNGIDLSKNIRSAKEFEPKTIISAGRLVPWKGFDCLIEIMKDLPKWKLFIAGDGPEKNRLLKVIESMNLKDRVFLLGQVDRSKLLTKLQECEVFVLNTSFESFSFQIVEAMSAGIPVISTNIGNINEIVENGEEGILISPNDKNGMLKAIEKFSDHAFRSKVVANAKKKSELFSIEKTMAETSEVIQSLFQENQKSFFKRSIILRYFVCGITSAATNIALLYVFTDILEIWYLYSSILSFLISLIVSFTLQKFVVFEDRETNGLHYQFSKFFVAAILGVLTNTALVFLCTDIIGIWYILSQLIAGFFVMIQNFILYKLYIFKSQ